MARLDDGADQHRRIKTYTGMPLYGCRPQDLLTLTGHDQAMKVPQMGSLMSETGQPGGRVYTVYTKSCSFPAINHVSPYTSPTQSRPAQAFLMHRLSFIMKGRRISLIYLLLYFIACFTCNVHIQYQLFAGHYFA